MVAITQVKVISFLSATKNIKFKIAYEVSILSLDFYWCDTWPRILKGEYILNFKKRLLRKNLLYLRGGG
jgi:hypothetical protein